MGERRIDRVESWRQLDDAITEVSGLVRLRGERASLERHLLRNFRKYAHREAPGPTASDWLSLAHRP